MVKDRNIPLSERLTTFIERSLFRSPRSQRRALRFLGDKPSESDQKNKSKLRQYREELIAPDNEENS